mgnify:CR=1 FL=1
MIHFKLLPLLAFALLLPACGDSGPASNTQELQTPAASDWLLDAEPSNAVDVKQAKASAEPGDPIVLRARIGGRAEPIADDGAVFTVMDLSVPHCGMIEGDSCPTPWDYCCEPPEMIRANAATVRLVDRDGQPLDVRPTAAGLAPLDEVVLVGTVGPRPTPDVLVLQTTGVHRVAGVTNP